MKRPKRARYERYPFVNSPWVQDLTQADLAALLGTTKDRLETLIDTKEHWIRRKPMEIAGKQRNLALPVGKLRTVHERLKYHLNKIKQPDYLFSPRKGRSQRDNAGRHIGQNQFLSLDIRQFYPSTTNEHIYRWARYVAGLRDDVAGMITHLVAIDGKMPFGSPVSPVLTTHVHRDMFDQIDACCLERGLKMSLWVDDLTISGQFIEGEVITAIRKIISRCGFRTHKIRFRSGGRPVIVTGVPVVGDHIDAPLALHERVQLGYDAVRNSATDAERGKAIDRLLSALGSYRYHVGATTEAGRKAANRMHALRTRRSKLDLSVTTRSTTGMPIAAGSVSDGLPWD